MSERRISDPSKLHLKKKDLTQIRKAARVLRDPGTTSSWKSPLSSSRSVTAASAWKSNFYRGKENSVFLCNWENRKSSGNNSGAAKTTSQRKKMMVMMMRMLLLLVAATTGLLHLFWGVSTIP
ncbi:hypothetical protein K1719_006340 [Acacia pycnantha]|nr:hypothetical protein K1719_006340 [Acacia pycnantha]